MWKVIYNDSSKKEWDSYTNGFDIYKLYITQYSNWFSSFMKKMFKINSKPIYEVILSFERHTRAKDSKYYCRFSETLCESTVNGKDSLIAQLESLRKSGNGHTKDKEIDIGSMINSALNYVDTL